MTTFHDGPAGGQTLMLRRCPLFLRVVIDGQTVDALDQVEDTPAPSEDVHVYVRQPGAMQKAVHVNTGRKPGGGWFCRADYKLHEIQPTDAQARSTGLWRQWCEAQAAQRIKA
ncbi:MAG: hypothetical protein ACO1TE_14230 [Prosthecobacter sp.]